MRKHILTMIGACIAGMFVMSVWGAFATEYGIGGGWFAGFMIIGTMWILNHFVGCHNNDGAWVDMALGIGVAGTTKVMFLEGAAVGFAAIPTLLVVAVGGAVGGFMAVQLEKDLVCKEEQTVDADTSASA